MNLMRLLGSKQHSFFFSRRVSFLFSLETSLVTLVSFETCLVSLEINHFLSRHVSFLLRQVSGYSRVSGDASRFSRDQVCLLSFLSRHTSPFSKCVKFLSRWVSFQALENNTVPSIQVRHILLHFDLQSSTNL